MVKIFLLRMSFLKGTNEGHLLSRTGMDIKTSKTTFTTTTSAAVVWRKVKLVIFVIFELGPNSESLHNAVPSESIRCGIMAFFLKKKKLWA